MSRKVILEEWLSLDGYVSDKEGKLDFFTPHVLASYTTEQRMKVLHAIDTILFGRNTYQVFSSLWPNRPIENDILATKINTLHKLVFSKSLQEAPWGQYTPATAVNGDAIEKIRELKTLPGKNIILWGSISLAQTFIKHNLVDEFHLHVCPVLTGGGRRLFENETRATNLDLIEIIKLQNGVMLLKYARPE